MLQMTKNAAALMRKNDSVKYQVLTAIRGSSMASGRAQTKMSDKRSAIGMNKTASTGRVLEEASSRRRIINPQLPRVRWCSMRMPKLPIAMLSQYTHERRYDCENCCRSESAPTTEMAIPMMPAISA